MRLRVVPGFISPPPGFGGLGYTPTARACVKEGANKQVISSQVDSLIKISRIWANFFPANTSNQPI
ncbi:Transposase, IS4 family [Escherichia coli]|nr:Transposase, IS4 family [Escherichia coli]